MNSGATFHNVFLGTVSWADYDNDGDLDLLVAGNDSGADILSIYRNNNATQNTVRRRRISPLMSSERARIFPGAPGAMRRLRCGPHYNLRVGTTPGGSNIVAPQSSSAGYRRLPAMGNVQLRLGARLRGLIPGTTYYWSVQSVDTAFAGSGFRYRGQLYRARADLVRPRRKVHNGAGSFSINLPLTGEPGVECRAAGGDHTLVFTFNSDIVSGNASVTSGTGSVSGAPAFLVTP